MNALTVELLTVAKDYLGPAAPDFLARELQALGVTTNTVEVTHVQSLAERTRIAAGRVMDAERAGEFAHALAERGRRIGRLEGAPSRRFVRQTPAKLFASGRFRQAEKAYREIWKKHGDIESCVGLARTLVSLEDTASALNVLRDGAAAFARKADRVNAVTLLGIAVRIAPADLNAHRRLAAALANQGDLISACDEYARFIDVALGQRDTRRAWLELSYGRETLGELSQLLALADRVAAAQNGAAPPAPDLPAPAGAPTTAPTRPTVIGANEAPADWPSPSPLAYPSPPPTPVARTAASAFASQPVSAPFATTQARTDPRASTAVVMKDASTVTQVETVDLTRPAPLLARAWAGAKPKSETAVFGTKRPAGATAGLEAELRQLVPHGDLVQDAANADVRATLLIGARDPRATDATLDAARRLLALRKLNAASDVLLGYIGAGFRDREAQRLLIEINCGLGRREVAREKCQLLGTAYRLDGRASMAGDVERLARIL